LTIVIDFDLTDADNEMLAAARRHAAPRGALEAYGYPGA
jgi:hypothetical protein